MLTEIAQILNLTPTSLKLHASFLENGGDSLSFIQLQGYFRKKQIHLTMDQIFSSITMAEMLQIASQQIMLATSHIRPQTTKRRKSFLSALQPKRRDTGRKIEESLAGSTQSYPLTEMQSAMLQESLSNPGMNIIQYCETHRPGNISSLKSAWKAVFETEPMLRYTYSIHGSSFRFVDNENAHFDWTEIYVKDEESLSRLSEEEDSPEGFFGCHFRVYTLPDEAERPGKSRVIWRVHHSLIDGYSHQLLLRRVRSQLLGHTSPLGTPFLVFTASLAALQTTQRDIGKSFWAEQYAQHPGAVTRIPFPTPNRYQDTKLEGFPSHHLHIDEQSLLRKCRKEGFTLATLYHAMWALTLARYTGSSEVCFGTVLSGRALPIQGIETIIGPTINTLPFHVKIEKSSSLADQFRSVMRSLLTLMTYQWTTPEHGFSRNFDTALNIQMELNPSEQPVLELLEPSFNKVRSGVPLQVQIVGDGRVRLNYDPKVYSPDMICQLGKTYQAALSMEWDTALETGTCLSLLLDDGQKTELMRLGNCDSVSNRIGSIEDDLVSLFQKAARQSPSTIALVKGATSLTYAELDRQSTVVSHRIQESVSPGAVVCVHADRSINWIIAAYAILKAGCVYCPLAEDLPSDARDQNFNTCRATLFLATSRSSQAITPASCGQCMCVEDIVLVDDTRQFQGSLVSKTPGPGADAYLCFTSGSSGKPKGVLCHHGGLVAFQKDLTVRLGARLGWKIAQFMSPAFDGSIHEMFSTLSYGATLILKHPQNPMQHLQDADAAILTPTVARGLDPDSFPNLKSVYLVGEAVKDDLCDLWGVKTQLYNMYGPTEATCGATIKRLFRGEAVSLGRPNPSSRIYILDQKQELAPKGVVGEICLAGIQVASGYIGLPKMTATRFVPDPIIGNTQTREWMYKTGDRGYWNEDGELAFLGRADRQIKLHGFRIDMEDLETQILQASSEATAVAITLSEGDLIAHVKPGRINVAQFKSEVAKRVPAYALPRHIFAVDSFPTTSVGKLDYKKMEAQAQEAVESEKRQKRASASVALLITSAIREVFDVTEVRPETNLFDLGASSMTLLLLSQRLSKLLDRRISVKSLLQWPSLQELMYGLEEDCSNALNDDQCLLGESGVAPMEADWWYKYQVDPDTSTFNVNYVCDLDQTVSTQRLAEAWNLVLGRHKILSCKYYWCPESGIRRSYSESSPRARVVSSFDVEAEINTPFQLDQGELIRVHISPERMAVVISHIICDLTTLTILLQEVAKVYQGQMLQPVAKTYFETQWKTDPAASTMSFWSRYLSKRPEPAFFNRKCTGRSTWMGTSLVRHISPSVHEKMKRYASGQRVTLHQMALAAAALALREGEDVDACDITLGAPYLNRNSEENQKVVGLFLEPLPIRIQFSSDQEEKSGPGAFIRAVQTSSRSALAHAVPFHRLMSHLNLSPVSQQDALFDAVVTFHEASQQPALSIPGVEGQHVWAQGAKFKLLAEFAVGEPDELSLRLEYSTECFGKGEIAAIGRRFEAALDCLSTGGGLVNFRRLSDKGSA